MTLVKTFDINGIEATSMTDIKADINAKIEYCSTGGKIHTGFNEAYKQIDIELQDYLDNSLSEEKPLFITGHSLGGALATVATKKLKYKHGIAECYTFGSPRVGNEKWVCTIKTPIYGLVNSADPVTILPPSQDTISISSWAIKFIPFVGKSVSNALTTKFGGYYHAGDMRYLTNVENKDYSNVELLLIRFHLQIYHKITPYLFTEKS